MDVLLDPEDVALVSGLAWRIQRTPNSDLTYVVARRSGRLIGMHRLILGTTESNLFVDHVNGNGLDNRRCNLRVCTHAENMRNARVQRRSTTGFKGVSFKARFKNRPFVARIFGGGKTQYLGSFPTAQEASAAYVAAARELYGEFHRAA